MDKVQIYYLVMFGFNVFIKTTLGLVKPNDHPKTTHGQSAIIQPIDFLFSLPIVGRLFGWW